MPISHHDLQQNALAVIMGGGAGKRLFPLTKHRSKPAVPFGGKYRLVDIPISNCINSGIERIYVLTQFNSTSLHRHIKRTYRFDYFSHGFVEILAAQQTPEGEHWYQGTADAVRQNLRYLLNEDNEYVVILSGDQLYRMDYSRMLTQHIETGADITIAVLPVQGAETSRLGILQVNPDKQIVRFVEKPQTPEQLAPLQVNDAILSLLRLTTSDPVYLASMGIYIFSRNILAKALENDLPDFGRDIIPGSISKFRVMAYPFQGYWEDIGTIKSFFEANIALSDFLPKFNFFEHLSPIYTHPRALPASKINGGTFKQTIVADGCIVNDSYLERCVVGLRSVIEHGCDIRECIVMGADYYESGSVRLKNEASGIPAMGIGRHCRIRRAIIDKNAHIGDGATISPEGKPENVDGKDYYIRDGIVVIPKNAVILPGAMI